MRLAVIFSVSFVALCFTPRSAAAASSAPCNDATLQGSYIFYADGPATASAGSDQLAYAAMIVYDGKGNAKFTAVYADGVESTLIGRYSIDSNCKGRVLYENGRTAVYFVSPSGNDLVYVVTNGAVVASSVRRVSRELLMTIEAAEQR